LSSCKKSTPSKTKLFLLIDLEKLTTTQFGLLLELAHRTDTEQRKDLQDFLAAPASTRRMVLRFSKQADPARAEVNSAFVETPATGGTKKSRPGRKKKKLQIVTPAGASHITMIPFDLDVFEGWLRSRGIKSAKLYTEGVQRMLNDYGMRRNTSINMVHLAQIRDSISGPSKYNGSKRTWLKKFNQFLIEEFEYKTSKAIAVPQQKVDFTEK